MRYRQFTATRTNVWTQNQSELNCKPVQLPEVLWQYYVHHRPKQQFVVNKATGMDINGSDVLNGGNFAPF